MWNGLTSTHPAGAVGRVEIAPVAVASSVDRSRVVAQSSSVVLTVGTARGPRRPCRPDTVNWREQIHPAHNSIQHTTYVIHNMLNCSRKCWKHSTCKSNTNTSEDLSRKSISHQSIDWDRWIDGSIDRSIKPVVHGQHRKKNMFLEHKYEL